MGLLYSPILLLLLLLLLPLSLSLSLVPVRSADRGLSDAPLQTSLTDLFPHISFDNGFSKLFGDENVKLLNNGNGVSISLTKFSGSGFVSKEKYRFGFFSTNLKLPSGYSAGVVVAFYLSNSNVYPRNHDEIDFEFLGHDDRKRKEWVLQTNLYGDGSVSTGREERLRLWFDPTKDYHSYSVLWNPYHIVYFVDNIPIREVIYNDKSTKVYPSKPMSIYSTIWDGSSWATYGGKIPVDYKYAPFVASFDGMEMAGCVWRGGSVICSGQRNASLDPVEGREFIALSTKERIEMVWVRNKFLTYSYCKDTKRYPIPLPECT